MTDRMALAYIGVGSNILPEESIPLALEDLSKGPDVTLTAISTFYRTAALPDPGDSTDRPSEDLKDFDPDFLNGVLELQTVLSPGDLLEALAESERNLGRTRMGGRYAPRTIDLDLLLYGRVEEEGIHPIWQALGPNGVMAHSDIERRPFVAHPLLELAPNLILPQHGTPLRAFAANFDTPGGRPEAAFTEELRARFLVS